MHYSAALNRHSGDHYIEGQHTEPSYEKGKKCRLHFYVHLNSSPPSPYVIGAPLLTLVVIMLFVSWTLDENRVHYLFNASFTKVLPVTTSLNLATVFYILYLFHTYFIAYEL